MDVGRIRSILHRHRLRVAASSLLLLLALAHAVGWTPLTPLHRLDQAFDDWRTRLAMPRSLDDRVVIVDIDEPSLAAFGQWPWSRTLLTRLVRELTERQQVVALGIDAVFAEPERSLGARSISGATPGSAGESSDADKALAWAVAQGPVVLGYYFSSDRDGHRAGVLPSPIEGQRPWPEMLHWSGYGANTAALAAAAPTGGFFNAVTDPDGRVRSVPVVAGFDDALYASLSLAMLRTGLRNAGLRVASTNDPFQAPVGLSLQVQGRTITIPLDARGAVRVPFRGPGGPKGGSFRYVSALDVVQGKLPATSLSGRYVLLGFTAPGLMDLRATAVGQAYPGVEIHASIISAALDGRFVRTPRGAAAYEIVLLLAVGALLMLWLPRLRLGGALGLGAGVLGCVVALDGALYMNAGLVLPLAGAIALTLTAVVANLALGYFVESRARQRLARQFATYVPPELVQQMLREPERYDMQARARELTVMFCDLHEFTSLAESMPATELQELLSDVLGRLSGVIHAHDGTIDKYMGDCIMAFWGAPVATDRHAGQAVDAALAVRSALCEINARRTAGEQCAIAVGIGLNTGTMLVGNMGSELRRAYTVIGDAVNLASRLEGLARTYGVDVVANRTTREQTGENDYIWQELDRVRVKGRQQVDTIYTVRGRGGDATPDLMAELSLWAEALGLWRQARIDECAEMVDRLIELSDGSELYRLYARRLAGLREQPPGPDWEAVTVFDRK